MSEQLEIETYGLHKTIGNTVTLTEVGIVVCYPKALLGEKEFLLPWQDIAHIHTFNFSPTWLSDWAIVVKFKPGREHRLSEARGRIPKVKNIKEVERVMNQWLGRYGTP